MQTITFIQFNLVTFLTISAFVLRFFKHDLINKNERTWLLLHQTLINQ